MAKPVFLEVKSKEGNWQGYSGEATAAMEFTGKDFPFFKSTSGSELNVTVYINIYSDVRGSDEML